MLRTTHRVLSLAQASQECDRARINIDTCVASVVEDASAMGWPVFLVESACGGEADVSRDHLEALLQSFLTNAHDHSLLEDGIRVSTRREGNCALIEIANTVSEDKRHHGIGAGAYLTQRLAAEMGAVIEAETEGDVFRSTILLPLRDDD